MNNVIEEIMELYSEWLEEEGVCSSSFIITQLQVRLEKEKEEKEYYKKLYENRRSEDMLNL